MITSLPANEVLAHQDSSVLADLDLSNNEIICMQEAWDKMRNRRHRSVSKVN